MHTHTKDLQKCIVALEDVPLILSLAEIKFS